MKKNRKTLLIVLLCLAVVTALSAGTLAVYTSHVDLTAQQVTAKKFYLGVNSTDSFSQQVKLAPTEYTDYTFTVTTVDGTTASEVPIDLTMALDGSKVYAVIPGATFQLFEGTGIAKGATGAIYTWKADNTANYTVPKYAAANEQKTQDYTLRVTWIDNATEANTATLQSSDIADAFKLTITGTQNTEATPAA